MKPSYTPMMMQYLKIKEKHQDALLFFRLGDFYEMFFDDAIIASKELEIALTGRDAGSSERIPMCGVPYHAASGYIERLVDKGYKVAIAEQMSEPGASKIVERDVIQVITPGTLMNHQLDDKSNHYIGALSYFDYMVAFAYADLSTGEIFVTLINQDIQMIKDLINALDIKELVIDPLIDIQLMKQLRIECHVLISTFESKELDIEYQYLMNQLSDFRQMHALNRLVNYLLETQKRALNYLQEAIEIKQQGKMKIDAFSMRNLELIKTNRANERYGSLLWFLDHTHTAMGGRLLKQWITSPLIEEKDINERLDIVELFNQDFLGRDDLKNLLTEVYDMERLAARVAYGSISPRDFRWLHRSLSQLPMIQKQLLAYNHPLLTKMAEDLDLLEPLCQEIDCAIIEQPPLVIKEGGFIKAGYSHVLDEYLDAASNGKEWLIAFEQKERERTGIKNLKVGYNRVFGYYIEISKGNAQNVKDEFGYDRRQSLANAERFIHPELKAMEDRILNAEDKRIETEIILFNQLKEKVKEKVVSLQKNAKIIAKIDVLLAFSILSSQSQFVRPIFNSNHQLKIKNGRHPIIEKLIKENYIENDIIMEQEDSILLITGPNMGGKSTFMRQLATIVIMAQIGSFVPATKAILPIFTQVFTRIGATDDLVSGQSTFMVEMMEAHYAIANADKQSLILFDELGRGTSTYDGMAIAQAIIEYIATEIKAKTLFSTHYHELTGLADQFDNIKNFHAGVVTNGNDIHFTYKMNQGASGQSYGINVARLAKMPEAILRRASIILKSLEQDSIKDIPKLDINEIQAKSEVEALLVNIDPMQLSPLEALHQLIELKIN